MLFPNALKGSSIVRATHLLRQHHKLNKCEIEDILAHRAHRSASPGLGRNDVVYHQPEEQESGVVQVWTTLPAWNGEFVHQTKVIDDPFANLSRAPLEHYESPKP